MTEKELIVIGAKERIVFKNALKEKVVARVDTGAKTSSVHCVKFWFDKQTGKKPLNFVLVNERATPLKTLNYKKRYVKSSNGKIDVRYSVVLEVKMGKSIFNAEFTLAQREHMRYKVLLGRNILLGKFLVDVENKFLLKRVK
ncbi:MAG: ATP-dependent zinc protease [Bacteroidia bacterium]